MEYDLSNSFHITIRFESSFKGISKGEAQGVFIERLRKMDIVFGVEYSNPIDVGINMDKKNWVGFIKIHLQAHTKITLHYSKEKVYFLWR